MGSSLGGYESSGSGGSGAGGNLDSLKDIARDEIRKDKPDSEQTKRRKVFLSFKYDEDHDNISMLRGQAKNTDSDLDFIDMGLRVPFDSDNEGYIKSGIRERIRQASVTLVMVSDKTHESKWVNWEIDESIRQGKGVVIVDVRKNPQSPMPSAVSNNSAKVKVVDWKHEDIMNAIDEVAGS